MIAYIIFSVILIGFIYPVILSWTWGKGWLYNKGFHDFAGTGVIHLVGGTAAFWGAYIVGERRTKQRERESQLNRINVDLQSSEIRHALNELNPDFSQMTFSEI